MGRRQKIGLDFFSLDVNFFSDIKIRKLIKYQGGTSTVVYTCLLCKLYENGYFLEWDDDLPFVVAEATGLDEGVVQGAIECCLEVGLFDNNLFRINKILTSKGIQERFNEISTRSKRSTRVVEYSLIYSESNEISSEEMKVNSENKWITSGKSAQSKVKESKVKESKEKNTIALGAAERVATQKVEDSVSEPKTPTSIQIDKPPPSSAAPPSTVTRDENGIATCQELRHKLLDYQAKNPEKYTNKMYKAFLRHWSEPNQRGKPLWKTKLEKKDGRFDIPGRLATWKQNDDENARNINNGNGRSNKALGSRSLAEPEYRGEGNVRKVEI